MAAESNILCFLSSRLRWDQDRVRRMFAKVASGDSSGLPLEKFHTLLSDMRLPIPTPDNLLFSRAFAAFNINGTERITWEQLRNGFEILSSNNSHAKLTFCFRAFDFTGTGQVSKENFHQLLTEVCRFMYRTKQRNPVQLMWKFVENFYTQIQKKVELRDFIKLASSNTELLTLLTLGSVRNLADKQAPQVQSQTQAQSPATPLSPTRNVKSPRLQDSPAPLSASDRPQLSASGEVDTEEEIRDIEEEESSQQPVEEEQPTIEITEFQMKLVNQIRALQAELKKYIKSDEEQRELIAKLSEENETLKTKTKTASKTREKSLNATKKIEQLENELTFLKTKYAAQTKSLESLLQWIYCPEGEKEEGFAPTHDPGVIRLGYALKQGEVLKQWKRRLFVLRSNGYLIWYTNGDRPSSRGSLPLASIKEMRPSEDATRPNLLEIFTDKKSFQLWFENEKTMNAWVASITDFLQKLKTHKDAIKASTGGDFASDVFS